MFVYFFVFVGFVMVFVYLPGGTADGFCCCFRGALIWAQQLFGVMDLYAFHL